jgi:hypothetical protein
VPWRNDSAAFDIDRLIRELDRYDPSPGSEDHDLLTALKHGRSRALEDTWSAPEPVRYAQAVLEIAVEWSMPAVERWAVAWLVAAGGSQFRLRWSSRSRDGKVRRDGLAATRITSIAGGQDRVVVGCESGSVEGWSHEAGLTRIDSLKSPVWAIAVAGERIFAAGADADFFATPETGNLPSLQKDRRLQVAGITAAAISLSGLVACGDEVGHVFIYLADGGPWIPFPRPGAEARVLALTFCGESGLRAIWRNGWITGAEGPPSGVWAWQHRLPPAGAPAIVAAAFDAAGKRLAIAQPTGAVGVIDPATARAAPGWDHPGVRSVAWSPDGLLASAAEDGVLIGEPGADPGHISSEDATGMVAFLDSDHLVAVHGAEVVQWAVREAGSDVPRLTGEDRVTAVAVDPRDPGRNMAGTWQGRVLCYDGAGSLTPLVSGEHIQGRVHQIARADDTWLIAAQSGAYRWNPLTGTAPQRLARRLCRAVAASGQDGAFAANHEVRTLTGELLFTFEGAVRDIQYGPGGCAAALDELGIIRVVDSDGDRWQAAVREGSRLLAVGPRSVAVWSPGGEVLQVPRHGRYRKLGQLPSDTSAVVTFDHRRVIVLCGGRGFGLASLGDDAAGPLMGVPTRAQTADTDGRRVVVAAGRRVAAYDLLRPPGAQADGVIPMHAEMAAGGVCSVTLPDGTVIRIPPRQLAALQATQVQAFEQLLTNFDVNASEMWESAARLAVEGLSSTLSAASQLGDLIWQAGLDLAVDLARGEDPDRPVRLAWSCDPGADELPWEIVQPTTSSLGWFASPALTVVRSVEPSLAGVTLARDSAGGPLARHTMRVIRGTGIELDSSDVAYQRTRRRTRRSNVQLLSARPEVISDPDDLRRVLQDQADILQVWAHCGPEEVRFSSRAGFRTDELANWLARSSPRLVVLIGCRSGALARALVERGVTAVAAMRVEVYSQTIQPLVEDLISLVLAGQSVDLAFAEALRRYVLTGQPGAVAVPMLYLAAGSSGRLFTSETSAVRRVGPFSSEEFE